SNSDKPTPKNPAIRTRSPVPLELCGMARAAEILGDRWSLLILREAFYGVVRFADMQADIKAPRAALSARLGKLVEEGLLEKFEYREDGARTRNGYQLSPRGRDLAITFLAMKDWWDKGQEEAPKVRFVPKGQKKAVRAVLIDEDGRIVDPAKLGVQLD
ncbi:MAG: helix-turn-helix transcriptional regulator, partial [Sneathiellales bacterium]|nr:helix-turn-helix transcriptional regulator [Sneathiellales bacterium]